MGNEGFYVAVGLKAWEAQIERADKIFGSLSPVTGRGVLTMPNPNGGAPAKEIFYLMGPSHFVFIDETPFPPNVFTPIWGFTPIFRFDPR